MRRFSYSVILLFVLSFSAAQSHVSSSATCYLSGGNAFNGREDLDKAIVDHRVAVTSNRGWALASYNPRNPVRAALVGAQKPITTITLGPDQIGLVKTAQGITTRIAFPEKVAETICGDLYDPASGRGTFVVQNSGSDVFLKPVARRGVSNLFVKTGEGAKQRIYSFDLNVVSNAAQAHRLVNVVPAAPLQPQAPAAVQPEVTKAPVEIGVVSTDGSSEEGKSVSPKPPVTTGSALDHLEAGAASGIPSGVLSRIGRAEPPPPEPEPPKKEEPKQVPPKIIRKSGGVLAGEAIRKPQPSYPPRAIAARVSGAVVVEVTVDESGKVIAARALSGHPLLRDAAVSAALGWSFNPTKLSGEPLKVIGTITFNFRL